jgi:hypothetical protein
MTETEHIQLNGPEFMPSDPYQLHRSSPHRVHNVRPEKNDKLRRFLENDRKVLRFFCVWDDRESMFGELREFVRLSCGSTLRVSKKLICTPK